MTSSLVYNIIFLIISIYVLLRTIGYSIYEIKEKENNPEIPGRFFFLQIFVRNSAASGV